MNTDAIRRFLTLLSSTAKLERGQLYQLVQSAEASYYARDVDSQREIGMLLQSFGYPFNQVGKFYESIYLYRTGQIDRARKLLEGVAESAPAQYRSKALLSLSGVEHSIGRFEESLRLHLQTFASCVDPVTLLEAQRGIALLRSTQGDHPTALRELERLIPLAQIIGKRRHPAYFGFLNSYAVELAESNRTQEAEQVASVIAASPFISRYPEWQETVAEIAARRKHSPSVAVPHELNFKYRDPRVRAAVDFMHASFHRTTTLTEIAEAINVSDDTLSRVFKTETGFSPIDYLIRLRLQKASQLLKTSFLSVKEVMAAVGYNSKGHFSKHFKRRFGITPSEYRKPGQN